jgi:hypothetical protein
MAGNFRGKSENALRINFRGFKFRDSNQLQGTVLRIDYMLSISLNTRATSARNLDK